MKKHHGGKRSRLKSYLIVAGIAAGVLLLSTRVPKIRAFVYGAPTA